MIMSTSRKVPSDDCFSGPFYMLLHLNAVLK